MQFYSSIRYPWIFLCLTLKLNLCLLTQIQAFHTHTMCLSMKEGGSNAFNYYIFSNLNILQSNSLCFFYLSNALNREMGTWDSPEKCVYRNSSLATFHRHLQGGFLYIWCFRSTFLPSFPSYYCWRLRFTSFVWMNHSKRFSKSTSKTQGLKLT
jgi:hypothetical protein